ncbi:hypothetical protein HDU87_008774 [Geranomyces variabilis]|uniref:NAD-dependent epimerase/dehydratase domain-containing protein n=1 Tax=Geranomyces variabilis TaxID=109894 RepID=A0AAD5TCC9_9FUNG|nr:hypothetical protein HDU87_008774 [Geranomyces variabilis]
MRVVVTGSTGFLGSLLVRRLLKDGLAHPTLVQQTGLRCCSPAEIHVVALGRNKSKGQELADAGAAFVQCDLSVEPDKVVKALEGAEVVFHCAAKCELVGRWEDFIAANVTATQNIVEACAINNVAALVHVSTPSVYVTTRDRTNLVEDMAASSQINYYAKTKLMAEEVVLHAVKSKRLSHAVILRPRGLIGPGDTTVIPRIVARMRSGQFPLIGGGTAWQDLTFVGNVVDSLLCAATVTDGRVHGKIYNVTNGEAIRVVTLIDRIAERIGGRTNKRYVPFWLAFCIGHVCELIWKIFKLRGEPTLTRYVACVFGKSLTLNIEPAKRELHYRPRVAMDEALALAVDCLR